MRIGTRIFLCYVAIFVVCFSYPVKWTLSNLRIRYLEGVEDPLVDQANILAAFIGAQMEAGAFDPAQLSGVFASVYSRQLSARIYSLTKKDIDMYLYITDQNGRVIFHSLDKSQVGQDYRKWRDVRLTLEGKYGARATRRIRRDPMTNVLYVAAPIVVKGHIAGVLTIVKPTTTINYLLQGAKPRLMGVFAVSGLIAICISYLVSLWMARPITRLTRYADDVGNGKRVPYPELDNSEIGEMGKAFERMREALEGKKYVEGYVQTLTHEIKSPLSAIRGAAELLEEKMEPEQRARFLSNIRNEAGRIQDIVDRLLELSSLEKLSILEKRERISVSFLVRSVLESQQVQLSKKGLNVVSQVPPDAAVEGDPFLLHQALSNLLQNAIDFSPGHGMIDLNGEVEGKKLKFTIRDHGPGFPDYAGPKLFDKFFSLQRPDTGKKSTGLGLNFVKEVAVLHEGDITLDNCPDGGVLAQLTIPCLDK